MGGRGRRGAQKPKGEQQKHKHGDVDYVVTVTDAEERLEVGGQPIQIDRDPDTGAYVSPDIPYESYASADELAQALIDRRAEEQQ